MPEATVPRVAQADPFSTAVSQVTSTRLAWTTYDPGHPLLIRSMQRVLGDGLGNTEGYRLSLLVAWEGAYLQKVACTVASTKT